MSLRRRYICSHVLHRILGDRRLALRLSSTRDRLLLLEQQLQFGLLLWRLQRLRRWRLARVLRQVRIVLQIQSCHELLLLVMRRGRMLKRLLVCESVVVALRSLMTRVKVLLRSLLVLQILYVLAVDAADHRLLYVA